MRSGWMRLWVVCSGIWLVAVALYLGHQYWLAATPTKYLVGKDDEPNSKVSVLFSSDVPEAQARSLIEAKVIPSLNALSASAVARTDSMVA